MADYQVRFLNPHGKTVAADDIQAETIANAIERARLATVESRFAFEPWQGRRLLHTEQLHGRSSSMSRSGTGAPAPLKTGATDNSDTETPDDLRVLARWYRGFAERTGNSTIWDLRLATAEDLEKRADDIERLKEVSFTSSK